MNLKKIIFSILLAASFLVSCNQQQKTELTTTTLQADYDGYKLIWNDEFDYKGHPDTTKWNYEKGYVRNQEVQYYTERRLKNCRVEEGMLIIEAHQEEEPYDGAKFTSASILTSGIEAWKYGRIEARVKVPTGKGTWPAFWMKGVNQLEGIKWPFCGEIDILEYVGIEPYIAWQTVHYDDNGYKMQTSKTPMLKPISEDFHVFGIDWDEKRIAFYIDGIVTYTVDTSILNENNNPFNQPFFLLLNLSLGSYERKTMAGELDPSILPVRYYVDYVRVYEKL